MSDFDRNYATAARGVGAGRAVAIDAGLRAYMIRVYNYMAMGVGLTGVVAWLTFQAAVVTNAAGNIVGLTPFGQAIYGGPAVIVLMLGTFGLVMFISFRIQHLQPATALTLFMVYAGAARPAAVDGVPDLHRAPRSRGCSSSRRHRSAALSLYGYTTQRNLSPIGSFLMMGLIGLIIAMVVNIFLQSTRARLRDLRRRRPDLRRPDRVGHPDRSRKCTTSMDDGTIAGRKAVMGALRLYLDFINLFLFLLRFLGDRR